MGAETKKTLSILMILLVFIGFIIILSLWGSPTTRYRCYDSPGVPPGVAGDHII